MPTLPSASHEHREVAEGFGTDAERYDRTRPRYPAALVESLAAPGREVLDVGCGTGIVARQLQAAGCRVLGVDPDARMAEVARRLGTDVEVAAFETWDPGDRRFDAVVAGQTWHWVDPVAGTAAAARALRPGGVLALFWNVFQPPPEIAAAFTEVQRRVLPGPFAEMWSRPVLEPYEAMVEAAAAPIRASEAFEAPAHSRYVWEHAFTRDAWLEQVPTFGGFSRMPAEQTDALLRGMGEAIDAHGGGFVMGYTTVAVTARRR